MDGDRGTGNGRLVTFTVTGALKGIGRWYDPDGALTAEEVADTLVSALVQGLSVRTAAGDQR